MKILIPILLLLVLSGCSARQCKLDGAYLQARETAPLVNPGDGEVPDRDPVYQIPPIPEQELVSTRTYTTRSGKQRSECIDRPPRLRSGS